MKKVQLIEGSFAANDAIELATQIIHTNIKFHENRINSQIGEESITMRETRIKQLQRDLFELRNYIEQQKQPINIHSTIEIE